LLDVNEYGDDLVLVYFQVDTVKDMEGTVALMHTLKEEADVRL
jgi:hypothetical protein